jgi:hypothetical protein
MNKLKIGLFGDSVAYHPTHVKDIPYYELLKIDFDLTNHGMMGSSLFFSYRELSKHHQYYDFIVFCPTSHGRLTLTDDNALTVRGIRSVHAKSNTPDDSLHFDDSLRNKFILDAITKYYTYIYNDEKELLFHNLLLEKIKFLHPRILMLDLFNWIRAEKSFYQIPFDHLPDYRHNHLTQTNHIGVYKFIKDYISEKEVKLDDYYRDPVEPYERYFK